MNRILLWLTFLIVAGPGSLAHAQTAATEVSDYQKVVQNATTFLRDQGQADDGSFSSYAGPAVTALVATSLMKNGVAKDDPLVRDALAYVERFVQPTGGVHAEGSLYKSYATSLAILCFVEANSNGTYTDKIKNAEAYLKRIQWGGSQREVESSDNRFGGFGYGKHGRPDLSNTVFALEALKSTGNPENIAAINRAIAFVSNSQNHESAHNTTPHAAKNPDGGFYYTPAGDGESKAGLTPDGGLRSYASMTYAGLKSMLYAGVDKNDPRVQAAVDWIKRHYDLTTNPGLGADGLFYYYHVFAKALDAMGQEEFVDSDGRVHPWRRELLNQLKKRQNSDGSWTNGESDRWMEGDPNLVTGYVLLALSYCKDTESTDK